MCVSYLFILFLERKRKKAKKVKLLAEKDQVKIDEDNNESNEKKITIIFIKRDSVYSAKCKCKT